MTPAEHHAARYAGEPPDGLSNRAWLAMVQDAAIAIAEAQGVPNDCTPEEYAAAALRSTVASVRRLTVAQAQTEILREARRGNWAAPPNQHLTYRGGLRRAAKVLDPMLAAAMAAEDPGDTR